MIDIRICKSTVCLRVQVEVKGHAETAPRGEDLVCAAVSALVGGYAKEITDMEDKHLRERLVSVGEADGNAMIDVYCKDERSFKRVLYNLAPIIKGLEIVAKDHPEALRVSHLNED